MANRYSSGNPTLDMLIGGLGRRESSMNFNAVGPATRNGDHAYGFSQVMGSNIGPWTQEVLGVRMSPQQYLNSPEAQFAVTSAKLGGYLNKYGNPEDALSMWHSGRPMARSGKANDGYVNTHEYVKQIMARQDPRSFTASATPQATGEAPMQLPGATLAGGAQGSPQATVGPQSISLGDEEQQPFNNVGSTLANMGAAIASLDNRGTGIASLNASRVAQNLSAQEAARERQGGWKYVGQTQNGQGMMFQNSKGEVRVEPLAPGFAGNRSDETSLQKDFAWAAGDPEKMKLVQASHGMSNKEPMDDATSQFWANMVLEDPTSISKVPQANRPQVMKDFVQSAKEAGYTEKDVVQRANDIKGNIVEDRRRSQIIAQVGSARPEFESAATNFVKAAEKIQHKFGNMPMEQLYNKTLTTLDPNSEDAIAINNMRIAQEGLTKGFVRAMSGSAAGNAHAEERMTKLFDPAMPLNMVKGGIGVLVRDVKNYDESARFARDNARARNAGKSIPHPELEDENAVLDRILGVSNQQNNAATVGSSSPAKRLKYNPATGELE